MKSVKMVKGFLILAMITAAASFAMAAEEGTHWHDFDNDFMRAFHHPMEGLELGFDMRLREVYNKNMSLGAAPFNTDRHWQRYRFRLSGKYSFTEDIDLNARYLWESWSQCYPDSVNYTDARQSFFDIMNLQFRNAFDMPLTVTVGRQEMMFGTGWLVAEGTPNDGSRTAFFDAARVRYDLSETSSLDLIYILQYDDLSKWLPVWYYSSNTSGRHGTDLQDEQAFIAYYTNKASETLSYDAYFMYKNESVSRFAQYYGLTGSAYDAEIYTLGGRLFGKMDENWSYSAEFAGQFGDRDGADLCAFGTNNKFTYSFNDDMKNQIFFGYEYLSGDNPDTTKDERFDILWGGYPQSQRGGDLQVYMWTPENGFIADISNLHRAGIGHSFKPAQDWTLVSQYNLLWADQDVTGFSSGNSRFRGHLLSAVATYQCCKKFKAHFMLDYLLPGDFYSNPGGEDAFFSRVNLEWTF